MAASLVDALTKAADLQRQWRFAAAREALTAVLATSTGPVEGIAVVSARRMLAEVLRDLGEPAEAYEVARPLVAACEQRFGAGHPATARSLAVLATVLHARGDLDAASQVYERVLDGHVSETGPAGRAVRLARAHRALLRRDRGDADRARTDLEAAYRDLRRAYGIADPDAIRFAVELARLCRDAGDVAAARRLLAVARAGCQARLDPRHPLRIIVDREAVAVAQEGATPAGSTPEGGTPGPPRGRVTGPWDAIPGGGPAGVPAPRGAPVLPPTPVAGRPPQDEGTVAAARTGAVAVRRPATVAVPGAGMVAMRQPAARGRRARMAVAITVVVAALVTALVVAGRHGNGNQRPRVAGPATGTGIPSASADRERLRVDLRDDGTALVARWRDPADGPVPVVVAVARDGGPATVVATLPPGTREYTVAGVDPGAGYCVIVAAARPGETAAGATSACTRRGPRPG